MGGSDKSTRSAIGVTEIATTSRFQCQAPAGKAGRRVRPMPEITTCHVDRPTIGGKKSNNLHGPQMGVPTPPPLHVAVEFAHPPYPTHPKKTPASSSKRDAPWHSRQNHPSSTEGSSRPIYPQRWIPKESASPETSIWVCASNKEYPFQAAFKRETKRKASSCRGPPLNPSPRNPNKALGPPR